MTRTTDWWRDAVIYQIYPRSFMDSTGDGTGDLSGITARLDYVAGLGADAIWVSPFVKSPMHDFGYDVSDFCAVEPMFGTMNGFRQMLNRTHELGMRLIMDQVWNHTSDQHPWFVESRANRSNPRSDWYVWADASADGGPPNNWRATFGGPAWTWDDRREQYYLHNFLTQQPDLNWFNADVRAAMLDIGRFWLDEGVDGFRLDVINFLGHDPSLADNPQRPANMARPAGAEPKDPYFATINSGTVCRPEALPWLAEIRAMLDEYPERMALGEISSAEDTLAAASDYVHGDDRLHCAYNAALISHEPFTRGGLTKVIEQVECLFPDHRLCWTFGTHDFPRLKSRWWNHGDAIIEHGDSLDRLLCLLLMTLPGSACIYQGDELGLPQAQVAFDQMRDPFGIANYPLLLGRDGCRTPMPWQADALGAGFSTAAETWLPIPDEHRPLAVDRQQAETNSLLQFYRKAIEWRHCAPALGCGRLRLSPTADPVLAFERTHPSQPLWCGFNLADHSVTLSVPDRHRQLAAPELSPWTPDGARITLPPYGVALLTD